MRCNLNCKNDMTRLKKHLNRKKECKCINFNFNNKYLLYILNNDLYIHLYEYMKDKKNCNFCNKVLFKYSINRHLKTCKLAI